MSQINGYKEELQDELQKTDPSSHASRLLAQGSDLYLIRTIKRCISGTSLTGARFESAIFFPSKVSLA